MGVAIMGKSRSLLGALSIGCLLVGSPCWAAIVEPGQGKSMINEGQGFKPITGSTNAKVGDSVMVGPGGTATITYDDGCKVRVQPGAVARITPLSPCTSGTKPEIPSWNAGTTFFGTAWLGMNAFIAYEAWQANGGQVTSKPASP